jgi:hypothetical protein
VDPVDDPTGRLLVGAGQLWARSGAVARVPVQGDSMLPLLADGDVVRVRAGSDVRRGDVVVARVGDGLWVHRVIRARGDRVVLRGDNTPRADPPVDRAAILGRVVAVEPVSGPAHRLDGPGSRAVALATAGYARIQGAVGRGPRPRHIPAGARRLADRVLGATTPEEAFVLLVARREVGPAAAGRARALAVRGLDWERVIHLSRLGQVGPLLYVGTRQLGDDDAVPAMAQDRLRAIYTGGWARGRQMQALLARTLERLAAEGIPVMGHKGVALVATVFGDPALHLSGDIDLAVADADHERASRATGDICQTLWDANPDRRDPDGFHIELDRQAHHDLDPSRHGHGHWSAGPLDWAGIRHAAATVTVAGQPMFVPDPTDLVLTLVANAVRRGFTPVRLVSDVAEAVASAGTDLDWARLREMLRASRLDRRSWIALGLAADWFDADVPADLLEPPPSLRLTLHEWWILEHKRRRPFWRVPTRVLWAGSTGRALVTGARLTGRL